MAHRLFREVGMVKSITGILVAIVVVVVLAAAVLLLWASSGMNGDSLARGEIIQGAGAPVPQAPGAGLKVITWNIGFGGGLTGQPTDRHPAGEVRRNLDAISAFIRDQAPDIVFLQEVDRPSSRTGMIDQAAYILNHSGMAYGCFVSTWRHRYVPSPFTPVSSHIGGVHSGQVIMSRYPILQCGRVPLPQPGDNAWWYNRFYLNRAIGHAVIDLGDGAGPIDAVNIHLEAFSRTNREEQARIVAGYVSGLTADRPLVMAGDFNSLPPFTMKTGGFVDEETDFDGDTTIDTIRGIRGLREVFIDDVRDLSEVEFHTFPAKEPSRRLDYVFYRGLIWRSGSVARQARSSDHLPAVAEFRP